MWYSVFSAKLPNFWVNHFRVILSFGWGSFFDDFWPFKSFKYSFYIQRISAASLTELYPAASMMTAEQALPEARAPQLGLSVNSCNSNNRSDHSDLPWESTMLIQHGNLLTKQFLECLLIWCCCQVSPHGPDGKSSAPHNSARYRAAIAEIFGAFHEFHASFRWINQDWINTWEQINQSPVP